LFAPSSADMYGKNHVTYVDPQVSRRVKNCQHSLLIFSFLIQWKFFGNHTQGFDDTVEGQARPGHFRGVATVVTKLFNIVQPTNAYFGQKDAAQCVLIRRIVEDLDMDVNIIVKDTIRETDGLAMSSRNAYLTATERQAAPIVYQSLCAARREFEQLRDGQVVDSSVLIQAVEAVLRREKLVSEIQYVSVDDKATMRPMTQVSRQEGAVVSLACKIGSVRLIDNIVL